METKTHWKKAYNPNYLGAWAFQPGEEKTVTIREVKQEIVDNPGGSGKEDCTVAYFNEDIKPLILNRTNCKMIAKVWGTPYIEDWPGHKITLKVKKVSAFGEMVDAVRVSSERPMEEVITCEVCGCVIDAKTAAFAMQRFNKYICVNCAKKEANNG